MSIDYSQWQSCEHDDAPRDQQRDLHSGYWAEIGPDNRHVSPGWSWTILYFNQEDNETVADGYVPDKAAAKQAVQDWADRHPLMPPLADAVNPQPPAPEIAITWDATSRYTFKLSNNDARKIFGLGGTSDEELAYRIGVLTQASPGLLRILMDRFPETLHTTSFELRAIANAEDGYPLWPEL